LEQLAEAEKFKKKELELQKEELNFGIDSIIGSCQMIEHSLSLSSQNDVRLFTMTSLYRTRLNYLLNNQWRVEPCHPSSIAFSIYDEEEESIYASLLKIGTIDSNDISAEKCVISRDEDQVIHNDEEFGFEVISYSKEGNPMRKGGNEQRFKIQIEGESQNHESKLKDLDNGKYEAKIKIQDEGQYSIHVKYDGINLPFTPFQIQVIPKMKLRKYSEIKDPKFTIGEKGKMNGHFYYPHGIGINSKGQVVVCDQSNNRIQIFDAEGKFISTFGSMGKGNGQFYYPKGLYVDANDNIYVCDTNNNRVQTFDSEGRFISTFGSREYDQLVCPRGICVDTEYIYVCDHDNNRIHIFDFDGDSIMTFGSKGNEVRRFNKPTGIAVNSEGNILVSDTSNHRVQILNFEGAHISTFGSYGRGDGQLNRPEGICLDSNDNILVCDYNNHRVQIFDREGKFMSSFEVENPANITMDPKTQNIFVCGKDHKIYVY